MKLEQSFTVAAPVETVWAALTDVMRVAPCLPGAELTEEVGEGSYKGEFKVKLGPTTAAYAGALRIEERDDQARRVTMDAKGTDKRGNGGTKATIICTVSADPESGETRVDVDTDFSITGKLARFGRGGMIQDVSNRLLREFAANLQEELAGEQPAPAVPAADTVADDDTGAAADQRTPAPAPPPPRAPAAPLDGGGLVAGVLAARAKAAAPGVLLGLLVGFLLGRRGR
jgi:carbon monoxide dehydrogenase subunit G